MIKHRISGRIPPHELNSGKLWQGRTVIEKPERTEAELKASDDQASISEWMMLELLYGGIWFNRHIKPNLKDKLKKAGRKCRARMRRLKQMSANEFRNAIK